MNKINIEDKKSKKKINEWKEIKRKKNGKP